MAGSEFGGRTSAGYQALPEMGHGPGVLVQHAWWGLTPFFENVCDRLAAVGSMRIVVSAPRMVLVNHAASAIPPPTSDRVCGPERY